MDHRDHVRLIREGVQGGGKIWADLGSGEGAFTSLHFEHDKLAVLRLIHGYLRPAGRLVLVEYDTDHGNPWVPFPLSFRSWAAVAAEAGFRDTRRLASVPSRFLGSIYSAVSFR
jgi:hypothetical protein